MISVTVSVFIAAVLALREASVVPTTYRPNSSSYNRSGNHQDGSIYLFFRRNSSQPANATYRLWGKTYIGHGLNLDSSSSNFSDWLSRYPDQESRSRSDVVSSSEDGEWIENTVNNDISTNDSLMSDADKTEDVTYSIVEEDSEETTFRSAENEPDVVYPSGSGPLITFEEISNASHLVIRARGVTSALWDTVNIVYGCLKEYWSRGLVQCLAVRTASMLRGILGSRYRASSEFLDDFRPRDYSDLDDQEGEARKKTMKKLFLPLAIAIKLKFIMILVGVAIIAGKAILLSTASFLLSIILYVKKAAGDAHSAEQITVYPSYYNKRVDDFSMNSLTGGRGFFMGSLEKPRISPLG